jgi:uncharacterized repeat protein (TIGR01451 family)
MVKENREFKAIKWVLTQIFIAFIIFENDAQIAVSTSSISNLLNSQFTTMSVSLSNIMVNGVPIDQFFTAGNVSSFNNPTNPSFPLPNGVLLTTGNGVGAIGPNTSGSFTNNLPATSNVSTDQALNYIANGTVTNGVVLEFDFIPAGDSVSFNYLFASDEYPEFSPSTFNDAFGFILWGPGISGPYTLAGYPSGGMNLALIPGTNSPVTINNVGPGATQNPAFYVNNLSGAAYGSAIQYDGSTTLLSAGSSVECGKVYHMKLAIGNVGDQAFDSGVFLKESSFTSTEVSACGDVYGSVYYDYNSNCVRDNLDYGQANYTITIEPGGYVATTGLGGFWYLDGLPFGTYTATIDTTNLNWDLTCPVSQTFVYDATSNVTPIYGPSFGLISTNPCTDPDVSIYAPFLRRCLPNQTIYVQACNSALATGILNSSYVDVELDPLMTVTGASIAYTALGNNTYRFQTGDIYPNDCVNFNITTTISCDAELGQTMCMDASLFPVQSCVLDTIPTDPIDDLTNGGQLNGFPEPCLLPWDQSSLSVDGWCQGDSVYFSITNTGEPGGGDMECYSPMWVTVDGIVTYTDSVLIPGGETIVFSYFGNGQTWILNAEQHPLHPGNSHPNAHVEACGDTANWTPNIVNDFPQDDADPVVDIYCGVVTGSYDPNDKTGYPNGYSEEHFINPNQQLQYVIRFQNTGNDTAFTVVIRDTIDYDLNIFTVTTGVASHPYEFRMYGPRVLEWTFNNILLPDSTTNLEGSNGFVTYHVEQVPDLVPGTVIHNKADIYFDFNEPVTTNETWHTIYNGFFAVAGVNELDVEGTLFKVYPNPVNGQLTIEAGKASNERYVVYDQMGKKILSGKLGFPTTTIDVSSMNQGIYFIQIGENKSDTFKIVKL